MLQYTCDLQPFLSLCSRVAAAALLHVQLLYSSTRCHAGILARRTLSVIIFIVVTFRSVTLPSVTGLCRALRHVMLVVRFADYANDCFWSCLGDWCLLMLQMVWSLLCSTAARSVELPLTMCRLGAVCAAHLRTLLLQHQPTPPPSRRSAQRHTCTSIRLPGPRSYALGVAVLTCSVFSWYCWCFLEVPVHPDTTFTTFPDNTISTNQEPYNPSAADPSTITLTTSSSSHKRRQKRKAQASGQGQALSGSRPPPPCFWPAYCPDSIFVCGPMAGSAAHYCFITPP